MDANASTEGALGTVALSAASFLVEKQVLDLQHSPHEFPAMAALFGQNCKVAPVLRTALVVQRPFAVGGGHVHVKRVGPDVHNVRSTGCRLCSQPRRQCHFGGGRLHFMEVASVIMLQETHRVLKGDATLAFGYGVFPFPGRQRTDSLHLVEEDAQLCLVRGHVELGGVNDGQKTTEPKLLQGFRAFDKAATSHCARHCVDETLEMCGISRVPSRGL